MKRPLPTWAELGREGWVHRGRARPAFAVVPGPGEESVWDYPRPPRLVSDAREIVVRLGETEIARTHAALRLLETSHPPTFYLPRQDVCMQHLKEVGDGSRCEWKGEATYFDVVVGKERVARAAWTYSQPFDEAEALAGHIAFYAGALRAHVAGELVRPQPGGFYGGWISSELVGPFKGDPGSSGW